jgi:hypothetical protein
LHSPCLLSILPCLILNCLLLFLTLPPDVLASSLSFTASSSIACSSFSPCLLMSLAHPQLPAPLSHPTSLCPCLLPHQFLPTPPYACFLFLTLPPNIIAYSLFFPASSSIACSSFLSCLLMSLPPPHQFFPTYSSLCLLPLSHPAS